MKHHLKVAGMLILGLYPIAAFAFISCWLGLGRMPEPLWPWLLFPFIIVGGWIVLAGLSAGLLMGVFFLRVRCPNLYEAIKGSAGAAISAPFKFIEAKAKELEAKGDRKTAGFYRKFGRVLGYLLFFGAMLLMGFILNWLGVDVGEGE